MRQLGEDVSEMLEYVPARFKVIRHVRPKLSCTKCDVIVQAEAPSRPIARGRAGPPARYMTRAVNSWYISGVSNVPPTRYPPWAGVMCVTARLDEAPR